MQTLAPFCDLDQDEIDRVLEVNLGSVLALTHVDVARFDTLPTQHAATVPQKRDR